MEIDLYNSLSDIIVINKDIVHIGDVWFISNRSMCGTNWKYMRGKNILVKEFVEYGELLINGLL